MDIPDQSTEGGIATAWYKGKDLKVLKAVYYGETGKMEWNYYDSSKLFFALQKDFTYNVPIYMDKVTAKANNEEAFDPKKQKCRKAGTTSIKTS